MFTCRHQYCPVQEASWLAWKHPRAPDRTGKYFMLGDITEHEISQGNHQIPWDGHFKTTMSGCPSESGLKSWEQKMVGPIQMVEKRRSGMKKLTQVMIWDPVLSKEKARKYWFYHVFPPWVRITTQNPFTNHWPLVHGFPRMFQSEELNQSGAVKHKYITIQLLYAYIYIYRQYIDSIWTSLPPFSAKGAVDPISKTSFSSSFRAAATSRSLSRALRGVVLGSLFSFMASRFSWWKNIHQKPCPAGRKHMIHQLEIYNRYIHIYIYIYIIHKYAVPKKDTRKVFKMPHLESGGGSLYSRTSLNQYHVLLPSCGEVRPICVWFFLWFCWPLSVQFGGTTFWTCHRSSKIGRRLCHRAGPSWHERVGHCPVPLPGMWSCAVRLDTQDTYSVVCMSTVYWIWWIYVVLEVLKNMQQRYIYIYLFDLHNWPVVDASPCSYKNFGV